MLFKPAQLGLARLDPAELVADRKACKKIGPLTEESERYFFCAVKQYTQLEEKENV